MNDTVPPTRKAAIHSPDSPQCGNDDTNYTSLMDDDKRNGHTNHVNLENPGSCDHHIDNTIHKNLRSSKINDDICCQNDHSNGHHADINGYDQRKCKNHAYHGQNNVDRQFTHMLSVCVDERKTVPPDMKNM